MMMQPLAAGALNGAFDRVEHRWVQAAEASEIANMYENPRKLKSMVRDGAVLLNLDPHTRTISRYVPTTQASVMSLRPSKADTELPEHKCAPVAISPDFEWQCMRTRSCAPLRSSYVSWGHTAHPSRHCLVQSAIIIAQTATELWRCAGLSRALQSGSAS